VFVADDQCVRRTEVHYILANPLTNCVSYSVPLRSASFVEESLDKYDGEDGAQDKAGYASKNVSEKALDIEHKTNDRWR
jgi:hypothetical protein